MITVKRGNITEEECDAIVNPANSSGVMGGGVALAIKKAGGQEIEEQARALAPIEVGQAVATTAGKLKAKYVIHAPTMTRPAQRIPAENVSKACRAALNKALELKIDSIVFPGLGTGVGGVSAEQAAELMVREAKNILEHYDLEIRFIAFDDKLFQAFKKHA